MPKKTINILVTIEYDGGFCRPECKFFYYGDGNNDACILFNALIVSSDADEIHIIRHDKCKELTRGQL